MVWGDYISFEYGKPVKDKESIDGEVPVYGTNGRIGTSHLPPLCKIPSLIVGRKGAYRGVHYSEVPFSVIDTAFYALPLTDKVDLKWAYYKFLTYDINRMDSGSAIPSTDRYELYKIPVEIPSMETQKKVVSLLDSLQRKISVNKQINDNLEQQAQAIFSTFISDHQTTTVTVEDIVLTANTGADAIQKAPIVDYDTGIRCVRVGDMSNQRPVHEWGFAQVTPEIFKQYQLHKDDIVVTRTASLGLNRLIGEDLSAVYNNGLIRISINQAIVYPLIVYRQFQTNDYRNYISRISGETSVRPNMKINYLLKYSFEIPCLSDQAELISILQPIFETQERNISENQILSSLRDTLLPKLMSGELDVSNLDI